MAVFLDMNDLTLDVDPDEAEHVMLSLAAGRLSREPLTEWLRTCARPAR
jgi:prophage maintenance system killer protein